MSAPIEESFARWRQGAGWSAIHWFKQGRPACGSSSFSEGSELHLSSMKMLTCGNCQRALKRNERTLSPPSEGEE